MRSIESMRLRQAIARQIGRPILGPQNSLGKLALENNWTQFDLRCIELWCYKITLTLMTTTMKCCWVNKNRIFFDFLTSRRAPLRTRQKPCFDPQKRCFRPLLSQNDGVSSGAFFSGGYLKKRVFLCFLSASFLLDAIRVDQNSVWLAFWNTL